MQIYCLTKNIVDRVEVMLIRLYCYKKKVDRYGISVSKMTICRKHFPHSSLITGFVTIETRRVPLVDQELLTLPGHLSSPMVISGVRVTRSLVYVYVL